MSQVVAKASAIAFSAQSLVNEVRRAGELEYGAFQAARDHLISARHSLEEAERMMEELLSAGRPMPAGMPALRGEEVAAA